ncbi:PhoX family phosphatase [Pseudoxanthobacter sp. M-2]|uniref:PhoX family protein n=1 Tax=Pseudoxanthobacter sp. M-2 TaxID=3078754 RepID=UPI0038FC6712
MTEHRPLSRAQAYEVSEDAGRNVSANPTMGDIIALRFSRRGFLKGSLAVSAIAATVSPLALMAASEARAATPSFVFDEVAAGVDERDHVAPGYDADVLIRWGDAVVPDAPAFDVRNQTAAAQEKQFGYNNDYIGYIPMPDAADPSAHGLLVINHEYTIEELMFPGLKPQDDKEVLFKDMTKDLVDIEIAAHGGSILEVEKVDGKWRVVPNSRYARRITGLTPSEMTGPAAGSDRLKTSADATGTKVLGMLNNCAGGITPWGTWLTCEENFNGYFGGQYAENSPEAAAGKRYGVPGRWYAWSDYYDRFDVSKEPNEPNRFGWVVEIDPFDPNAVPKKRTALGRYKHEGAASIVNKDGRVVVYMGDDERFDYVYRFVTARPYDAASREANLDLLDEGTLSAARYDADGTLTWLPLVFGEGPLTAENGFASQADVLIETRRAADLVGATKMDRPEGTAINPQSHAVYVMLTNNTRRESDQVDAANPRPKNAFGHIIEMMPVDEDHTASTYRWEVLVQCGDPSVADVGATFSSATTKDGWFGMPDMVFVDADGRLWVGTDGMGPKSTGRTDGLYAVGTSGEERGTARLFYRCPVGAELCGPVMTPDLSTYFVAVQHPGEGGDDWAPFGRVSTFDDPSTRWPDFDPAMPPRPAVVAITRQGGGPIAV